MNEFLSKFNAGETIALVAVGGGLLIPLLCGITAILFDGWYKIRQLALKQEMLNRGMSAEEIRLVLDAGRKASRKESKRQQACQSQRVGAE
jgi:hypothetical protein